MTFPELIGQIFGHGAEQIFEFVYVDGIVFKRALGTQAFSFLVGNYRTLVNALRFIPNLESGLLQGFEKQFSGHFLHCFDVLNAELTEGLVGNGAYAGNGFNG